MKLNTKYRLGPVSYPNNYVPHGGNHREVGRDIVTTHRVTMSQEDLFLLGEPSGLGGRSGHVVKVQGTVMLVAV